MAGLFYAHDAQEEDVATRLRVSAEIVRGTISIESSLRKRKMSLRDCASARRLRGAQSQLEAARGISIKGSPRYDDKQKWRSYEIR